jgi:ribose 5-phosphate isomerase B
MAARVSQIEGQRADPGNFLLMHAMGPNVAGVIGSAVAAGFLLALLGYEVSTLRIVIGSDHAGFYLKRKLLPELETLGHIIIDVGSYDPEPVDFPDIGRELCGYILSGDCDRGIMFCGTGVGAAIACNKVRGIRASVCHDVYTAHQCVEHDDVQVIALGAQIIGHTLALELIQRFLTARFLTSKEFRRRVEKLDEMDAVPRLA